LKSRNPVLYITADLVRLFSGVRVLTLSRNACVMKDGRPNTWRHM